jgi:hypothetical protein
MSIEHRSPTSGGLRSRTGLVLVAFLAIAAFFLVTEHTAPGSSQWAYRIAVLPEY